jgi:hypothetical protein
MGNAFDASFLHDLAASHANMVKVGAEAERNRIRSVVSALEREYRKAQDDEKARIPTALSLAIEAMIALRPQGASPYAERRMQPREGDMTTHGEILKPGN